MEECIILQPIDMSEIPGEYVEDTFKRLDLNTGNLMFAFMVQKQLKNYKALSWGHWLKSEQCNYKRGVIPCANFLIPGKHKRIKQLTEIYKNTDFPITMIGLGAQAEKGYETPKKLVELLEPETIQLFQMAGERSVSLGVRGEFTAECLSELGVKNCTIIGCPSFYQKLDGSRRIIKKPTLENIVFGVTRNQEAWVPHEMEKKLLNMGMNCNGTYIMQMLSETTISTVLNKLCPKKEITVEQVEKVWPQKIRFFSTYEKWQSYLKRGEITFSVGSRFHGNMAAFHAGIPALWITHDMRTKELAETLNLPSIDYEQFSRVNSLDEVLEYCNYDKMEKCEKRLYNNYVEFLDTNNLQHMFKFD